MSLSTSGPSQLIKIGAVHEVVTVRAVTFTANGKYLVSGGYGGVRVWQIKDGKQVAMMPVKPYGVECLAVSKDGRWIAAGSELGGALVWDAKTYEQVFARTPGGIQSQTVWDVDFSPDSTRLVSADGGSHTATIWDIAAHQKVRTLDHSGESVLAAKYSPQGDRVATATETSVRVWDSSDGRLRVDIKVPVDEWRRLLWSNDHLFFKTKTKISQVDAVTGSIISEWSVSGTSLDSRIAIPQHGKFIAYSTSESITFWNASIPTQLGFVPHNGHSCSIAFCPSGRLLAIAEGQREIMIKRLYFVSNLDIPIDGAALDSWKNGHLANAEALLTTAISLSEKTPQLMLASRALVRARLKNWDAALVDALESLKTEPSVLGYIAKFVAHVGKKEMCKGFRACDIALHRFHSDHAMLLLLIKAVVLFMAGNHEDGISRMDDLIALAFSEPSLYTVQAYMHFCQGNLHLKSRDYEGAIRSFERAWDTLGGCIHQPPLVIVLISGWSFDGFTIAIQQHLCEALLAAGRTKEAGERLLHVYNHYNTTKSIMEWTCDFMQKYLSTPVNGGSANSVAIGHSNASHPMASLLREWARLRLTTGTWKDALAAATSFTLPRSTIYQVICERLETIDRVGDAITCFHQMRSEATEVDSERDDWTQGLTTRCCRKLEVIGDSAMKARQYDEAILKYSAALLLEPSSPPDLLAKRSKAHAGKGEWENALNDANAIISRDPSCPFGYERKHEALHGSGYFADAIDAFETMLSKVSESSDPDIRERYRHYVTTERTKDAIRAAVKNTIRDSPVVLINSISGRLCNKLEQAAAFELTSAFTKLISSMTTHIDHNLIKQVVGEFYRYATFSHTWQDDEPLFEKVTKMLVYDLPASAAHDKLQMFCNIVREEGFNWAWSDTCCIDKGNHFVLQEALVSMFKWYEGSAMTIIFLCDVDELMGPCALTMSIWNMRGWTLQEYHASKVVRIYTKDWTPYLGLKVNNHKDAPEIISEMEGATGISAQALMELRPGLNDIRQKLRLASTRQTTRIEDAAYSLLGIFSVTLPVTYGEGDQALGRLLAQLLMNSGDTSILAWTGISGGYNSCFPASIAVFNQFPTSHIPPAIADGEMEKIIAGYHEFLFHFDSFTKLYDLLDKLSVPWFTGRRMKLPCLTFKLGRLATQGTSEHVFRARTMALGTVELNTQEDLSQLDSLCLVHPWIDFLLDRHPVGSTTRCPTFEETMDNNAPLLCESPALDGPSSIPSITRTSTASSRFMDRLGQKFTGRSNTSTSNTGSLSLPSSMTLKGKQIRLLQFIARLRQPFGALLLTRTRQNREYRRVAAESLITVQIGEITPEILDQLIKNVQTLDVL